jgi:uncharacterized protein (DUF305 family)
MAALSFVSMYVLMYAMVDRYANVLHNINQAYMAGLMTSPMVVIELLLMRAMYENRKLTVLSGLIAAVALCGFFVAIRRQTAVSDEQFLRSMIPHHAGAILMCEQAKIRDAQVQDLCRRIISSQEAEISEMKAKLADLSR